MNRPRFKLWKTLDLDGHTDEWDIIDTHNLDIDEGHICEEEVVELMNKLYDNCQFLISILWFNHSKDFFDSMMFQMNEDEIDYDDVKNSMKEIAKELRAILDD